MRIVVTNGYSSLNKGDAAIAEVLLSALREFSARAELQFVSVTPELDAPRYAPWNVDVIGEDLAPYFSPGRVQKVVRGLSRQVFGASDTDYGRAIRDSDLVVACGGGYLNDGFGPGVLLHTEQLKVAKRHQVPTVLANQSVGPFHSRFWLNHVKQSVSHISAAVVRERQSIPWAEQLGLEGDRIILAPDLAFGLGRADGVTVPLELPKRPFVAVTVRWWTFPGHPSPTQAQDRYLNAVTRALTDLAKSRDVAIVFLPQVIGPGADDDRIAARRVAAELLRENVDAEVLEQDLTPQELSAILLRSEMLVGTRMHSNIFSLNQGTPVVAIAYEHKTTGIMSDLGLGEFSVPISEVNAEGLSALACRVYDERQMLRPRIEEAVRPLKMRSVDGLKRAIEKAIPNANP